MTLRMRSARPLAACLVCLGVLGAAVAGCSSNTAGEATTLPTISLTTRPSATTTTTAPIQLSELEKELAKTSRVQNDFAAMLLAQGAAQDDPRQGLLYGLRARTQALTCRKALDGGDLMVADAGMKDIRFMLNLGRDVATGSVAETLADARAEIETLGLPSDDPQRAKTLLDRFIATLAPLLDEATELTPSTTSP